jgi:hypothetical protein
MQLFVCLTMERCERNYKAGSCGKPLGTYNQIYALLIFSILKLRWKSMFLETIRLLAPMMPLKISPKVFRVR